MKFEGITFPVFRKYKNNKSYFKIISPRFFEELQVIGDSVKVRETKAERLPEMNFVRDLLVNYADMADEITEQEYEAMRTKTDFI